MQAMSGSRGGDMRAGRCLSIEKACSDPGRGSLGSVVTSRFRAQVEEPEEELGELQDQKNGECHFTFMLLN